MENCFILLGVPTNKSCSDEEIRSAIEEKRNQWQKDAKNPKKQIQAKQNIALIPQIEEIMFSPSLRQKELVEAKKRQQKYITDLKNESLLMGIKGFITEEEFSLLLSKYKDFSLSEETIKSEILVPIGDVNKVALPILNNLPEDISNQFKIYFTEINEDDMSIYTHYAVSCSLSPQEIIEIANKKLKEILNKGTKESSDAVEQKIAGLIINVFESSYEQYKDWLSGFRFLKLNEMISTAIGTSNKLSEKIISVLVKVAKQEYSFLTIEEISSYIINNCVLSGVSVDNDTLIFANNIKDELLDIDKQEESIQDTTTKEASESHENSTHDELFPNENHEDEDVPEEDNEQHVEESKETSAEPVNEEYFNLSQIINKMITPVNVLLSENKGKTLQIRDLLSRYQEQRIVAGSGISKGYAMFCFAVFAFGSLAAFSLFLMSSKFVKFSMLAMVLSVIELVLNIFSFFTFYSPYSRWKKMTTHKNNADAEAQKAEKLYKSFISLNFGLLNTAPEEIEKKINVIQKESEQILKTASTEYKKYTNESKQYIQKQYFPKLLIACILFSCLTVLSIIFLPNIIRPTVM